MTIFLRYLINITAIFFLASNVYALSAASTLAGFLNTMRTMKADFIQTTYDNHNQPIQQSYGKMALHRPGQFRWQVIHPLPQLMIANGPRLWVYDADLEQVTIRPLHQAAGEVPGLLLSHVDRDVEKDFTISESSKPASDQQWFLLVPKSADNMFASIQLGFNKGRLQEMRLADHLGHTTRIVFRKIQLNAALPGSLFVFKPQSGVDVIDESKRS